MYDVARTFLMNSVRSRDAQQQWARTSLNKLNATKAVLLSIVLSLMILFVMHTTNVLITIAKESLNIPAVQSEVQTKIARFLGSKPFTQR